MAQVNAPKATGFEGMSAAAFDEFGAHAHQREDTTPVLASTIRVRSVVLCSLVGPRGCGCANENAVELFPHASMRDSTADRQATMFRRRGGPHRFSARQTQSPVVGSHVCPA